MVANVSGNYGVNPYAYNNAAVGTTYSTNLNADTSYLAQQGQDTVSFSGKHDQQKTESKGKKVLKAGLIIGGIALAAVTIAAAVRGKKINGEGAKLFQNIKTGFRSIFTKVGRAEYRDIANKVTDKLDDAIEKLPLFDPKNPKAGVYKDTAGNRIVIDKYGTGIVDYGNNKFFVTNGPAQKFYDGAELVADDVTAGLAKATQAEATTALSVVTKPASTEVVKTATKAAEALETVQITAETNPEVAKTIKEAQTLIKVLKQDPSDKTTYTNILKLIHPDNAIRYGYGASVEKDFQNLAAQATQIFEKAK